MKRSWTVVRVVGQGAALGMALAAALAMMGCNDYGNTFQNPTGAPINFIAPSDTTAGGPDFTITVTSNSGGFVAKTVVQWDGKTIPSTYVNSTQMTATVAAALIAKPGTAFVNTLSPHSGTGTNGLSNTLSFTINPAANPVPSISAISPNAAAAGAPSFTLTVSGSSFLASSDPSGGSQVRWNLGPTQTTLPLVGTATATQITATVDTSLLVNATTQPVTAIVTVYNPPSASTSGGTGSGGGVSPNGLPFTINPAGGSMAKPAVVAEETPAVSADGRYVAFTAVQEGHSQVFVRDTCEGAAAGCQSRTTLLSAAADGTPANEDSKSPSMSADGRYVAFSSAATNLPSGAAVSAGRQVYLRDTCFGAADSSCKPSTQLVSSDSEGALVGAESILPSVSSSGRFVAFLAVTPSHAASSAKGSAQAKSSAAAADGTNSGYRQVFVRDTCLGAANCTPKTTRISLQPGDTSNGSARPAGPALSGSSNRVALSGANSATVFTRSVAVDDRVFLALTAKPQ